MKKRTIIIESIILVAMIVILSYFTIMYMYGESESTVKAEEEIDSNLIKYVVKAKSFMKSFNNTDSMRRAVNFISNLDEKSFDEIFDADPDFVIIQRHNGKYRIRKSLIHKVEPVVAGR